MNTGNLSKIRNVVPLQLKHMEANCKLRQVYNGLVFVDYVVVARCQHFVDEATPTLHQRVCPTSNVCLCLVNSSSTHATPGFVA